jgi:hypothetical protein
MKKDKKKRLKQELKLVKLSCELAIKAARHANDRLSQMEQDLKLFNEWLKERAAKATARLGTIAAPPVTSFPQCGVILPSGKRCILPPQHSSVYGTVPCWDGNTTGYAREDESTSHGV